MGAQLLDLTNAPYGLYGVKYIDLAAPMLFKVMKPCAIILLELLYLFLYYGLQGRDGGAAARGHDGHYEGRASGRGRQHGRG